MSDSQSPSHDDYLFEYQDIRLDLLTREVWVSERPVSLSLHEFAYLASLIEDAGTDVSIRSLFLLIKDQITSEKAAASAVSNHIMGIRNQTGKGRNFIKSGKTIGTYTLPEVENRKTGKTEIDRNDVHLDLISLHLTRGDETIRLTEKQARIITALMVADEPLTRGAIIMAGHTGPYVIGRNEEENIMKEISRLNKRLKSPLIRCLDGKYSLTDTQDGPRPTAGFVRSAVQAAIL